MLSSWLLLKTKIIITEGKRSWQTTKFSELKSKEMCSSMCGELGLWARGQEKYSKSIEALHIRWKNPSVNTHQIEHQLAFFIVKLLIGILQYLHSMLYLSTSYCQANSFRENRNSSKWLSIFLSYRGYWMNVRGIRILSFLDGGISLGRALQRYNSYPEAATQCCPY